MNLSYGGPDSRMPNGGAGQADPAGPARTRKFSLGRQEFVMADTALSLRERAEFLLRVAPHASTPRAAASLESLAREYLQRAKEVEEAGRPWRWRSCSCFWCWCWR